MIVKTKGSRPEGRKHPPEFNQLLHSSQMKFWHVGAFPTCPDFAKILKDLLFMF